MDVCKRVSIRTVELKDKWEILGQEYVHSHCALIPGHCDCYCAVRCASKGMGLVDPWTLEYLGYQGAGVRALLEITGVHCEASKGIGSD